MGATSAGKKKGAGGALLKVVYFIVGVALLIAILTIFHWDPFGILDWLFRWGHFIVTSISDWLLSMPWFRKIFTAPPR